MLDLTIAVVRGLDWVSLRPYAVSLAQTRFKGVKAVFMENTSQQVRDNFENLGFTCIDRTTPVSALNPQMPPDWAYGVYRFLPVIEYLKRSPGRFRYVIWTDVRDLIFQSDPSVWLEQRLHPNEIVVAGLGHAIKDCPYNDPWVRACDPADYERVREYEAVACGTFAGTSAAMLKLMEDIYNGCLAANHPWATDQGMLNCLVRRPEYARVARVPRMAEAFSAQWFPAKDADPIVYPGYGFPVFDKGRREVLTREGLPFSTVHLYDRDPAWVAIMREKYATYKSPEHLWMDAR
jgi:hypothetical protein